MARSFNGSGDVITAALPTTATTNLTGACWAKPLGSTGGLQSVFGAMHLTNQGCSCIYPGLHALLGDFKGWPHATYSRRHHRIGRSFLARSCDMDCSSCCRVYRCHLFEAAVAPKPRRSLASAI